MKRIFFALALVALSLSAWTVKAQDAPAPEPTQLDVLFVGDSITDFWDNDGWGQTKLGLKVFKQYYDGPRRVMNIGVSGDTWEQTMGRLDQERVANIKPTLIQLMIGTNNLDRGGDPNPPYIIDGIGKVIEKLKTKWPEAKILVLGVFPRGFEKGNHYQTRIDVINKEIPKFADGKQVVFKDISEAFLTKDGLLDPALFPDQLHPNEAGYYKWAEAVEPFFKETLGGIAVQSVSRMNEKWCADRHAQKLEQIKNSNGQIDIVYLGDSITHNWENQGKDAWAKYYGNRKAINLGYGADRTEHVLWRLDNGEADGYTPKLVVLMIGTNNVGHRSSTPRQTIEGIRAILEKLGQKWPETKVVLLPVFPRGTDENDEFRKLTNEINAGLPALCDGNRVVFFSFNDKFLTADKVLTREVMPDLLHPAPAQYFMWAESVEPFVEEAVGGIAVKPAERLKEKWWADRHAQKLEQIKQSNGQIDIVYLGDSITNNWDNRGKDAWNQYYGNRKAINLGFSGDRTEHVLWRLDNGEADGYTPKLVVMMIGTNNIGHRSTNPAQTIEGIHAILNKLGQKWPQTKVVLLPVFPRGADENDGFRKQVNEINAGLPALCDGKRVVFFSFNDKFLTADKVLTREVMPDLLHPAPAQYFMWAESVEPFVEEALGGNATKAVPRDKEKWWTDRHAQKMDQIKNSNGQIDLVYLGDSITHGWEGAGKDVWAKYYGNRKAINLGYGGDRTEHVLWRLDNGEADGYSPKLVIVMIGTNNVGGNSSTPAETVEGINAIVRKLNQKWPEATVLLLGVFPRGADENDVLRQRVNAINVGLPAICDGKKVIYLNFGDKFLTPEKVLTREMMSDLLHPGATGYNIWAETVEPFVKQALGE